MATPEWIFQSQEHYIEEFTKKGDAWEPYAGSSLCSQWCTPPLHVGMLPNSTSLLSECQSLPVLTLPPIFTESPRSPIVCKQVSCSSGLNGFDKASLEQWSSVPNVSTQHHSEQASLQCLEQLLTNHFSQLKANSHQSLNGVTLLQQASITIEEGHFTTEEEFMMLCSSMLRCNGYVFCPGLSYSEYMERYYSVIRFHSNKSALWKHHLNRHMQEDVFKLPKNATIEEKGTDEVCCSLYKHLHCDLEHLRKKSLQVSPARRANRQAANLNHPIKYLSPTSAEK